MALRAMAFHDAISADKLAEIFKADKNALFGASIGGECGKCKMKFAVFFPAKDDPDNQNYLATLNAHIEADCKNGKHRGEYSLTTTP